MGAKSRKTSKQRISHIFVAAVPVCAHIYELAHYLHVAPVHAEQQRSHHLKCKVLGELTMQAVWWFLFTKGGPQ